MGPARIESIKAFTPPQAGDLYDDDLHGRVRLIRPGGGASWICAKIPEPAGFIRPRLNPAAMRRVHED